jgi:hypothetical protein
MTPLRIEPLAQCLNHLRHRTPRDEQNGRTISGLPSNYSNAILFQLGFEFNNVDP